MIIHSAQFIKSSTGLRDCPGPAGPEFGFIGRSNVGKSSLINMLTGFSKLAKTSSTPGKTRTINHFLINDNWFLVDLPGYGYAKVRAGDRDKWIKSTREYISERQTLICVFVLLDTRHEPLKSDLEFMEFLGKSRIPFARVFTKADKLSGPAVRKAVEMYDNTMFDLWEELPVTFITSAEKGTGRTEILNFISECINNFRSAG